MFVRTSKETPKSQPHVLLPSVLSSEPSRRNNNFPALRMGLSPSAGVSPPDLSAPYLSKQQRGALPPGALPASFGAFGKNPHPKAECLVRSKEPGFGMGSPWGEEEPHQGGGVPAGSKGSGMMDLAQLLHLIPDDFFFL